MPSETEVIRAMFDAKQSQDMEKLLKINRELKPFLQRSNEVLHLNSPVPQSAKAQ